MLMRQAARKTSAARQIKAEMATFPAPVAGLISNRALSQPESGPQGAVVLDNFFPTATGATLRRGSAVYVQVGDNEPVRSLFKYVVGNNRKLFVATDTTIYDISIVITPVSYELGENDYVVGEEAENYTIGEIALDGRDVWNGALGGDWYVVQFATTGGVFLVGVNGQSVGFIYDGASFYPNVSGGVWALSYDALTSDFTAGQTVTGGTSGATAVIHDVVPGVNPGEGALLLTNVTGTFVLDEAITDGDGGAATVASDATNVVPGAEFPNGLTTADMAYVWVYKNALWFAQKESLSAWYMPVDQIGGEAKEFPLGAEFGQGGSLLIGQSWSLNASGQGGLSDQCVFLSTEGEVVVYQGTSPDQAATWSKVGLYRIGSPMGRRGFIRAGGDLVFATTIGFVALSTAVQVDLAALSPRAVSYSIEDDWNELISRRGQENWVCMLWPENQMVAISPPLAEQSPAFLVSNARTGAWGKFTNWSATCMEVFNGRLFFGTPDGYVMEAMIGGTDNGVPFTGTYMPLFSDNGKPTMRKAARIARVEMISGTELREKLSCRFDFDTEIPSPPDVEPVPIGNEWDNAIWDQSIWGAESSSVVTKRRHSVSGYGYRISPVLQITSGSTVPLDATIVALDVTYEIGDIFS
ncbi:MAG: hypothetical protein NBV76_05250 [Candidatus Ochrobactrum gambitense]|nr:MAG: hypothetical protein NBV76_05250 [Candidatus Ochrobactrum gambitense]WEK17222.1 MAG: hypothetical protein P0Y54_05710 [Candidatus Ochrobactrum gambitense]